MNKGLVETMLDERRAMQGISEKEVAERCDKFYNSCTPICGHIFTEVPLELIHIDPGYQRTETFCLSKANQIAADFSDQVYEPIKLNYRDGGFYCPSGQHRIYAHLKMGRDKIMAELISCSRKEEIAIFLYQDDNRSKLQPYDRWKAGCEIGSPADMALKEICSSYGVEIGKVHGKARLRGVTVGRRIIESSGKEMLNLIFETIVESGWKDLPHAFDSRYLRGLHKFYVHRCGGSGCSVTQGKQRLIRFFEDKTPVEVQANALVAYPKDVESALIDLFTDVASGRRRGKAV